MEWSKIKTYLRNYINIIFTVYFSCPLEPIYQRGQGLLLSPIPGRVSNTSKHWLNIGYVDQWMALKTLLKLKLILNLSLNSSKMPFNHFLFLVFWHKLQRWVCVKMKVYCFKISLLDYRCSSRAHLEWQSTCLEYTK
jgi:hypothetical protein